MKKILLPLALLMSALLVSCESTISVYPTEIMFDVEGGEQTITVTSSGPWSLTKGRNWYKVSENQGGGADVITVTAYYNTYANVLSDEIVFRCGNAEAIVTVTQQPDNNPIIKFKDHKFLEALLDAFSSDYGYIDKNDDQISEKEAAMFNGRLLLLDEGITNMDEISYFSALKYLDCSFNQLTSLNVTGCTALEYLDCSDNQITSLNVTGCTALEYLNCSFNQLTSLNVTGCTALKELYCYSNQLSTLDVKQCVALTYLDCMRNQLSTLNLVHNTALTGLDCNWNPLEKIILSRYHMISEDDIQAIISEYGDIIEYVD